MDDLFGKKAEKTVRAALRNDPKFQDFIQRLGLASQ